MSFIRFQLKVIYTKYQKNIIVNLTKLIIIPNVNFHNRTETQINKSAKRN